MKRLVAAAAFLFCAAVSWLGSGTGEAAAQVLWPEPQQPPTFGGQMIGRSEAGGSWALPIVEEQISVDVDGQHASMRLRQTFHNRTSDRVEGLYTLRAGPGTRANGFAYWNGEKKIVGEVFERGVARQVYQNVTRQRRDPDHPCPCRGCRSRRVLLRRLTGPHPGGDGAVGRALTGSGVAGLVEHLAGAAGHDAGAARDSVATNFSQHVQPAAVG